MKTKPLGKIEDMSKVDSDYSCTMDPVPGIVLKSETHAVPGRLVWAYVPKGDYELEKKIVFIADEEIPVDVRIIENFSTKTIPPR